MAHGTPASLADMPEYLKVVRGGRPPSPELIEEMTHNYNAIGGRSPLTDITLAQADALAKRLGTAVPVVVGMRNWHPYIKEAMHQLSTKNVDRVIGLPLAPQFSTLSVQKYMDAAATALPAGAIFEPVRTFHAHPLLLQAFAERVRDAAPRPNEAVVFTAHSLPTRVIEGGDVYANEVAATAKGVAAVLLNPGAWVFFATTASALMANATSDGGTGAALAAAVAMAIGVSCSDLTFTILGSGGRRLFGERGLRWIRIGLAVLLVAIGVAFLTQGIRG